MTEKRKGKQIKVNTLSDKITFYDREAITNKVFCIKNNIKIKDFYSKAGLYYRQNYTAINK